MTRLGPERFRAIVGRYASLRIGLLGDFCLDRYWEIDPALDETSIETGLPVHNVVRVRSHPGGAGTILNNLVALGVGSVHAFGFAGEDGEGYELTRALASLSGVVLDGFVRTPLRATFTYGKPLLVFPDGPPRELSRLDVKNRTPTPAEVEYAMIASLDAALPTLDALVVLDQVDRPDVGVVTTRVLAALGDRLRRLPMTLADSRRGLAGFPPVAFKMNRAELATLLGRPVADRAEALSAAATLAQRNGADAYVTLAEDGMAGATPTGETSWTAAHPIRGPIDVVGAGDAVTANLAAARAAGASLAEALELASAAASVVLHQVGRTGVARVPDLAERLSVGAP